MQFHFSRRILYVLAASLVVASCVTEALSVQRRTSRRVTNPVRAQRAVPVPSPLPSPAAATPRATQNPSDPTLISTADEQGTTTRRSTPSRTRRTDATPTETENDALRQTVNTLSTQVTKLADDMSQIKEQQRAMVDLERLSRAEQRAEGFRAQLRDVVEREADLQGRMEQLDYELQPENIQRRAGLTGSLRPDELRAQIQRQLEAEKRRVQAQLDLLATSRTRLETAIVNADAEVERLRARLDALEPRQTEAGTATTTTTDTSPARPAPAPTTTTPTTEGEPPLQL